MAVRRGLVAWMVSALLVGCSGDAPPPAPPTAGDPNEAPSIDILEPLDGDVHFEGDVLRFSATVSDDGDLSDLALAWDSDRDGLFSTEGPTRGGLATFFDTLSLGDHVVTVTATDAGALSATDTVQLTILAYEVSLVVDSVVDAVDASPGDGLCDDGAGNCTLRAAIMEANAWDGSTLVTFAGSVTPGTFTLAIDGFGEDDGLAGDLDVDAELSLVGAGAAETILDGGGLDRVLHVHPGNWVTLSGVTIRNGDAGFERGGGILNEGTLAIASSHIVANRADGTEGVEGGGGGLCNHATVTLTDSTIRANVSGEAGGGLCNIPPPGPRGADMTLVRCTVSDNIALTGIGDGGGVASYDGALAITNSTISGNTAEGEGGGIHHWGDLFVSNSTISANQNPGGTADGIRSEGTARIGGTLITSGPTGVETCRGTVVSLGYNLDSDDTCGLTAPGDLPGLDPLLHELQDNGGVTETCALQAGSPAIDAIPVADCTDADGQPLTADQRGTPRPQGSGCDIGAYEAPWPALRLDPK